MYSIDEYKVMVDSLEKTLLLKEEIISKLTMQLESIGEGGVKGEDDSGGVTTSREEAGEVVEGESEERDRPVEVVGRRESKTAHSSADLALHTADLSMRLASAEEEVTLLRKSLEEAVSELGTANEILSVRDANVRDAEIMKGDLERKVASLTNEKEGLLLNYTKFIAVLCTTFNSPEDANEARSCNGGESRDTQLFRMYKYIFVLTFLSP